MLVLLSPSKNLHTIPKASHRFSLPRMPEKTALLIKTLKKLSPDDLRHLMGINEKLALLNYDRYHSFLWPHQPENATASIYSFRGEVYLGFDANTLTRTQAEWADRYIRILSGLYGLLRPLDLIQPYRLEMSTALKVGSAKNLYEFWGRKITELLLEDIASTPSKAVINLASQEYIAAVQTDKLKIPVIDIQFLEDRNGKLQFLSYNAKRSRGWMARYIIDQKITNVSALQGFDLQGYSYREDLSHAEKMVFVR